MHMALQLVQRGSRKALLEVFQTFCSIWVLIHLLSWYRRNNCLGTC